MTDLLDTATTAPTDTGWMGAAACRGATDAMFPAHGDISGARAAIAICATCPVLDDCRTWVLHDTYMWRGPGIIGGLSAGKRKRLGAAGRDRLLADLTVRSEAVA